MIDFKLIAVMMLFVILVSIQLTLNKIYVEIKKIRMGIDRKEHEEIYEKEIDRRF